MKKIVSGLWKHKIISLIVLTAVIGGGYFLYQNNQSATAETRYLTQAAQTGTLIHPYQAAGKSQPQTKLT